jgi:hypothetical protein
MKFKKHKIYRVRAEFARLGRICDEVAVTGYSRSLVSSILNGRAEVSTQESREAVQNSCDMDKFSAEEQPNMENFGSLQYIIDKLPDDEMFVVWQYFVYGWTKTRIADWLGKSTKVVDRILRNLRRIDLTGDKPMITFRGKTFELKSLSE